MIELGGGDQGKGRKFYDVEGKPINLSIHLFYVCVTWFI